MLRVIQSRSINHAKSYFSSADYYSEGRETVGRWRGEGARLLGLEGTIKQADWDALCDNRDPHTGDQLTVRHKSDRTVGYDFNFHVPKSVSLLYATTKDERITEALRESVGMTMQDIEEEMATRVRKGGKNEERRTGNMVWGEYTHLTSRAVDGVPDPHLHVHCYAFNTTFDHEEERWKAGQFRELKRDAPYFEAKFYSRFAERLVGLRLPVERTAKGWELEGVDRELVEKFSRRTQEIEKEAKEKGITNPDLKAELGAKTRKHKQKNLKFEELQGTWRSRMSKEERSTLDALADKLGGDAEPMDAGAAKRAIEYATSHVFTRKSVVPERHLLATALKHSIGEATTEQVHRAADRSGFITGERNGRRMVTTRDVLEEERQVIAFARGGRGTCKPFVPHLERFENDELNAGQKAAVKQLVESHDRVTILSGAAGVGKTTLMKEAAHTIEKSGTKVFAFAPSTDASRIVLRNDGFKDAETVATLLVNEKLQRQIAGQLVWIDEAGLMDIKTTAKVFDLADRLDARILLSGDRFQHGSVAKGDVLHMLESEAGIKPAEVRKIQRQETSQYREAIQALSEHRIADGYARLDELNWIKEMPYSERYKQMAADYVDAIADGKSALVVAPTHLEGERVTREIREALKQIGDGEQKGPTSKRDKRLTAAAIKDKTERTLTVLENVHLTEAERTDPLNYSPGEDVLVFHQNAKGFQRGQRVEIDGGTEIPVDEAARFQVFRRKEIELAAGDVVRITHNGKTSDGHRLDNGSVYRVKRFNEAGDIVLDNGWTVDHDFGHLAHGYVATSHASQGKTYERVFVAQGRVSFAASSREQFYVSASRGTEQVTIYTEDKEELLDAVSRSEDRVTATEFVNSVPFRQMAEARERPQPSHEREERQREEPVYER